MPLGRGLSSLIPSKKFAPSAPGHSAVSARPLQSAPLNQEDKTGKLWHIPLSLIRANSYQPRKTFDHQDLEDLINSIKEHGIIQPLVLTEAEDGKYEMIAGERRLRAAQVLEMPTVPAVIKDIKGSAKLEVALIENIQRKNLNSLEEAFAFERLIQEFGLTQEQVGKKVGKSRPYISNTLRLLELPEEIQQAIISGTLNTTAARAILGLEGRDEQLKLFRQLTREKKSVHAIEDEVSEKKIKLGGILRRDPQIVDYENRLRDKLGTKVKITHKQDKGSIVVEYYSEEELRRLIKVLL